MNANDLRVVNTNPLPAEAWRLTKAISEAAKSVLILHYDALFEYVIGAEVRPNVSHDEIAAVQDQIEHMIPPPPTSIEGVIARLTKLKITTAGRALEDADWRATLRVYAEPLSAYPLDILDEAFRGHKWWPPLAELIERCEKHQRSREIICSALQHRRAPRIPEATWEPPTDEDKAYVDALLARMRAGAG